MKITIHEGHVVATSDTITVIAPTIASAMAAMWKCKKSAASSAFVMRIVYRVPRAMVTVRGCKQCAR